MTLAQYNGQVELAAQQMTQTNDRSYMINVSINGKATDLEANTPLSKLMSKLQNEQEGSQKVAVALNGEFVARSTYANVTLNQGDELDIVAPVGGG